MNCDVPISKSKYLLTADYNRSIVLSLLWNAMIIAILRLLIIIRKLM